MNRKFHLATQRTVTFEVRSVEHLFDPENSTLVDSFRPGSRLLVVMDESTQNHKEEVCAYLSAHERNGVLEAHQLVSLEDRQHDDSIGACMEIAEAGVRFGLRRTDSFLSIAGPHVTDIVGLAAAMYRRSCRCVRVHSNIEGLFHSLRRGPRCAIRYRATAELPPIFLSLSQRDTLCLVDATGLAASAARESELGAAEILRVATIMNAELFELAESHFGDPQRKASGVAMSNILWSAIRTALSVDIPITATEPSDPSPLEFGAPFTELLAASSGTGRSPAHSLSAGMALSSQIAQRLGILTERDLARILALLEAVGLPRFDGSLESGLLWRWLQRPQAWGSGRMALVVPGPIGEASYIRNMDSITPEVLGAALRDLGGDRPSSPTRITEPAAPPPPLPHQPQTSRVEEHVAYFVRSTAGLLDLDNSILASDYCKGRRVLAIVDAYPGNPTERLRAYLDHHRGTGEILDAQVGSISISSERKNMDAVLEIIDRARSANIGKHDLLVAVGGGTLMDTVGFAAALYHGGIAYLRVPTTLVGMIDAGIGLKVGVNFAGHKNFVGAYYPSMYCVNDPSFLKSLPPDEMRCGISEVIKMAIVKDPVLFDLTERYYLNLFDDVQSPEGEEIVNRSISTMLEELEANPYEDDLRRLPDFGHEFGHMIESLTCYRLRHGEAVAIGMSLSSYLAYLKGRVSARELHRILDLLLNVGLPVYHSCCDPQTLWEEIFRTVLPHKGGKLHLVIPEAVGLGGFIDDIEEISAAMMGEACSELAQYASRWNARLPLASDR